MHRHTTINPSARRRVVSILAVGTAALVVGAPNAAASHRADNVGKTRPASTAAPSALTLRLGTDDQARAPGGEQIEEFARRVAQASDGEITIEPVWAAAEVPCCHEWDQEIARRVAAGEFDLGMIPSRAWDTEGVTTLQAINTPFLITSDSLLADVVSGPLADDLMSGLDEVGVVGLALLPEGLRHPFGFDGPLLGPDDYDGAVIRTFASNTVAAMFTALGATTDDGEVDVDLQTGMESAYRLEPTGVAAGNVTFYPKVNSLVINADSYAALSDQQRELLRQAAEDTRSWAIDTAPSDADSARAYCERGGTIVNASDDDLRALQQAVTPVVADLERDPTTSRLIDEIAGLSQEVSDVTAPADTCDPASDAPAGSTETTSALDGVYQFEITDDDLIAGGITAADLLAMNHGTFVWTLDDGRWSFTQTAPNPEGNATDEGTYRIDGGQVTVTFPSLSIIEVYNWTRTDDGDLVLKPVKADPIGTVLMTAKPWERIGDPPE